MTQPMAGFIVSGLNHLAHDMSDMFAKGKLDREIDVAYGNKADSEAPATRDTLYKMKDSLPTLKRLYPAGKVSRLCVTMINAN